MRQMMAEMLTDARERGEPLAGLIASESVIYGRFGFGRGTDRATFEIDTRASAFLDPVPPLDLRLVDKVEAATLLPPIFEQSRRGRPGEPNRLRAQWDYVLADRRWRRQGSRAAFTAASGGGYARYRFEEPDRIVVEELRGVTPEIESGLWRYALDIDLIERVTVLRRPVDEPVRWRLADPRQLRTASVEDRLNVRVLDVPAALQARSYRRSGRVVLELLPPRVEEKGDQAVGVWVLEAGPDGASCRKARAGEAADLRMEVTDLGSLYLGGFTASAMRAGGRIEVLTDGSLEAADALFASPLAPSSGNGF
jgi:predicted acetyltransferase